MWFLNFFTKKVDITGCIKVLRFTTLDFEDFTVVNLIYQDECCGKKKSI